MPRPVTLDGIDRHADRPPYRQIADQLRAALDGGDLEPGDKLPSEAELMQHYGVARMTARQAIQELRSEGRVVAEQGRGVFVAARGWQLADVVERVAAALDAGAPADPSDVRVLLDHARRSAARPGVSTISAHRPL